MALFPHYEANPATVRGIATTVLSGSTRVSDLKVSVDGQHNLSVAATGGLLTAPLQSAVLPLNSHADDTAQCATIAGGALNLFAKDIDTYNRGVDELNARYATAAANGFYVNADNYYNHGATLTVQQRDQQYHTAVANAASSLKSSLVAEEAKLRAGPRHGC